jgi:hypothetical protein
VCVCVCVCVTFFLPSSGGPSFLMDERAIMDKHRY